MHMQGVDATSLDQILTESGTGKSQMYHYFSTKTDLVEAVLRHQLERVLVDQRRFDVATWDGIERWLDGMLQAQAEREFRGGCPLGSLVAEVVDRDDRLRAIAAEAFSQWERGLATGLMALQERGGLRRDADPGRLAEEAMATIQGGYLLSTMKRDAPADATCPRRRSCADRHVRRLTEPVIVLGGTSDRERSHPWTSRSEARRTSR